MGNLETLRQTLPDYSKDIRLNLGSLLGAGGVPELTPAQKWGCALAAAIACRNLVLTRTIADEAAATLDAATGEAARSAAALMAMTNVYYRATHMADDPELGKLPAGLRMNAMTKHGIAPADFELFGLAASVVKGCEACTRAHVSGARKHGASVQSIQAAIKIAAVLHAAATVLDAVAAEIPAATELAAA